MRLKSRWDRRKQRSGAAIVEFAVILPLLVTLMLGLWELGRAIQVFQSVSNAAREGARQAATAKYTKEEVRQAVFDYLKGARIPLHDSKPASEVTLLNMNATIVVENLTTGGEVYNAAQLDRVKVTVSVPVKNYQWLLSNTFLPAESSVISVSSFLCTRDVPITIDVNIPQQPLPPS